jgi:hypothetical protein
LLALVAAEWSFRRSRAIRDAELAKYELDVLGGLVHEVEVSLAMAERASPTPLPVGFLRDATALRRYMTELQRNAFRDYSQAVLRYNGRVERLVSYGIGKRAAGLSPGSEKPTSHAKEVQKAGADALALFNDLLDERQRAFQKRLAHRSG